MALQNIFLDTYRCNGCGSCVEICPEIFSLSEATSKAELIVPEPEITEKILEAIAYCPEKCIELREE